MDLVKDWEKRMDVQKVLSKEELQGRLIGNCEAALVVEELDISGMHRGDMRKQVSFVDLVRCGGRAGSLRRTQGFENKLVEMVVGQSSRALNQFLERRIRGRFEAICLGRSQAAAVADGCLTCRHLARCLADCSLADGLMHRRRM